MKEDERTYLYHFNRGLRDALVDLMMDLLSPEDQKKLLISPQVRFMQVLWHLNPDASDALSETDAVSEYTDAVKLIMEHYITRDN